MPPYTGHFRVTADTPKGLVPINPVVSAVPSKLPQEASAGEKIVEVADASKTAPVKGLSSGVSANVYESSMRKNTSSKTIACNACGSPCNNLRYHNTKTQDLDLCASCFTEGRFPSGSNSSEFVKLSVPSNNLDNDQWTDHETLLLLEGVEMFDDNWSKVAEHVGTRTREQCVLKFLQLPIEDSFLEKAESLGPLQYNNMPFSQTDNPVMSVVAFLASLVNPGVASAAAQAALKEISTETEKMPSSKESGKFDLHKAASTALGAAAIKAKVLADHEDREMQRLVNAVVELQLKKLELKMSQFEELEQIMEQEKREIERQRRQLYLDRIALQKNVQELNNGNIPSDGFNVALVDQREANMLVDQSIAKPNDVTML